jgi:hypothetical protein
LVEARAAGTPTVTLAVDEDGRRLNAAELRAAATRTAAGLHALGVTADTPVSWMLPNWPEDGQHRVLHRAESGQRGDEHDGFEPAGQHPGHGRVGAHPERVEARGGPFGEISEVLGSELAAVLVDEEEHVRGGRGAGLDELPEAAVVRLGEVGLGAHPQVIPPSIDTI